MRRILFETLARPPLTEAAPGPDDPELAALAAELNERARRAGSGAAWRSGRSTPAPATAASSKSTR